MKNFKVTTSANGITISQIGGGSVSVKNVNGELLRTNTGLQGKDHQYALNISKFIEGVMGITKHKKAGVTATMKTIGGLAKELTECTSFRNLSNRLRRLAEEQKVTKEGQFFYEG